MVSRQWSILPRLVNGQPSMVNGHSQKSDIIKYQTMLKNYFTTAFRNFWRNKTFSIINVFGLAIGISSALVIFLIVYYEFSFDKFEKDSNRIYRVVLDAKFNGNDVQSSAVQAPLSIA